MLKNKLPIIIFLSLLLWSCASTQQQKQNPFKLQSEIWNETDDTSKKEIYITDAKSINQLNPQKLIFDVYRLKSNKYPDSIYIYSRVFDSLGNFATNMAFPYNTSDIKYFTDLDESLGKIYKKREVEVPEFNVREYGAADSVPFTLLLSIDYSGSMDVIMDAIHEGTRMFVKELYPSDKFGITTYNESMRVMVEPTSDKAKILSEFEYAKDKGYGSYTAVWDAVYKASDLFDKNDTVNPKVIVLFSDGDDNYSKKQVGDLIEKAKQQGINIFTVAFGYSLDDDLKAIAKATGGKFYKARSAEELRKIFKDILMSLRYYYLITYKPPVFWGLHTAKPQISFPNTEKNLASSAEYDTGDMFDWSKLNSAFERPILFDYNKSEVKPESFYIIDEIVDAMLSKPSIRLEIQGHTDNVGNAEFNMKLSEARALAVMNLLISKGIEERRLRYRGFGFTQPVATNDTEENKAKNRRTVFVITAK